MLMPPTGTTIGFGVLPLEEFDFPAIPQSSGPHYQDRRASAG